MAAPGNWQILIEKIQRDFDGDGRIDMFKSCHTEAEKVSYLSKFAFLGQVCWITEFFSKCQKQEYKDLDTALRLKREGTECFQKKMYMEAVQKYSKGILNVPVNSEELGVLYGNRSAALFYMRKYKLIKELFMTKSILNVPVNCEELGVLYGKRSAALFYMRKYKNCLEDISQAKKCRYPMEKNQKILVREINCHIQLGDSIKAEECARLLEESIENTSVCSRLKEEKNLELTKIREKIRKICKPKEVEPYDSIPCVSYGENKLLVQASNAVSVASTEEKGRYVTADQNIQKGDTLIVERPYAAVLLPENTDTHCHHCFTKLSLNYYPCRRCTSVRYCNYYCANTSWDGYHRIECPYLKLLYSVGIAHLSLRVVITAGLQYLKDFMNRQQDISRSQRYKGFDDSGTYCRSYQSVYDLMTHSDDMETEDLLQYTLTALLLLEILRHSGWFKKNDQEKNNSEVGNLKEDELLVGALLLRHILQLVCNAHAITELKCSQSTDSIVEEQNQVRIATAIYPTASLMNHSCDPSIIASFDKDTLVVRAVKDIKKGDEVYNCYGPHHKRMNWDERQQSLQQQYFFLCRCIPCTEGKENSDILYSYRCPLCEGPAILASLENIQCKKCGKLVKPDHVAVRQADSLFEDGIKLLQKNKNKDAVDVLLRCCEIRERLLYRHNKVLSETQDCLARCYASIGNFEESVKFLQRSIETVKVIYGADSIETGNELHKLSEILISAHRWNQALDCVSDAIQIFTENYGKTHDTVKELSNMKEELVQVIKFSR